MRLLPGRRFTDERLQGPLAHWPAHSQQPPTDPGTGAGAQALNTAIVADLGMIRG